MLVAFFGIISLSLIMLAQPYGDLAEKGSLSNPDVVDDMAEHFVIYKNVVVNHVSNNPVPGGPIRDSDVSAPDGWAFPSFNTQAFKTSSGWVYIWSDVGGAFFLEVYDKTGFSASICKMNSSGDCNRPKGDSSWPSIPRPTDNGLSIPQGSTVYAWKS